MTPLGSQFITSLRGLNALNLDTGSDSAGDIVLTVASGGIADGDGAIDIRCDSASILLSDAGDVGSPANPISFDVTFLGINTAAFSGSQFIAAAFAANVPGLKAGAGSVDLVSGTFHFVGDAIGNESSLIVGGGTVAIISAAETGGSLAGG